MKLTTYVNSKTKMIYLNSPIIYESKLKASKGIVILNILKILLISAVIYQ